MLSDLTLTGGSYTLEGVSSSCVYIPLISGFLKQHEVTPDFAKRKHTLLAGTEMLR